MIEPSPFNNKNQQGKKYEENKQAKSASSCYFCFLNRLVSMLSKSLECNENFFFEKKISIIEKSINLKNKIEIPSGQF